LQLAPDCSLKGVRFQDPSTLERRSANTVFERTLRPVNHIKE
jgi:hypothetical protein